MEVFCIWKGVVSIWESGTNFDNSEDTDFLPTEATDFLMPLDSA